MKIEILKPVKKIISTKGRLYYSESYASWNSLRFRKEIMQQFPQLKERLAKFTYKMLLHPDYKELEKTIRKVKREKEPLPILLWLVKEKKEGYLLEKVK